MTAASRAPISTARNLMGLLFGGLLIYAAWAAPIDFSRQAYARGELADYPGCPTIPRDQRQALWPAPDLDGRHRVRLVDHTACTLPASAFAVRQRPPLEPLPRLTAYVVTQGPAPFRIEPSKTARCLWVLSRGSRATVVGRVRNEAGREWEEVLERDGQVGYVWHENLAPEAPGAGAEPAESVRTPLGPGRYRCNGA